MTILEDASAPPFIRTNGGVGTSAAFNPPAGSLLMVIAEGDYDVANSVTFAISDNKGGTGWTRLVQKRAYSGNEIWVKYLSTAQTGMTITVTPTWTWASTNTVLLTFKVLTGASATQNGPTAVGATHQITITPTTIGSRVYGSFTSGGNSANPNPNAATTVLANTNGGSGGFTNISFKAAADTSSLSAMTLSPYNSTGLTQEDICAVEILPAAGSSTPNSGGGAGAFVFAGAASGSRDSHGGGAGALLFAGTAAGDRQAEGSGIGAVVWSGTADGSAPTVPAHGGGGDGALIFTGAAGGARDSSGAGAGALTWAGAASGQAPVPGQKSGGGDGTLTWAGTADGSRASEGSGAGSLTWAGAATGAAPSVDQKAGGGAGALTWFGTADGRRGAAGDSAGTLTWAGIAAGGRSAEGSGGGFLVWSGTASGDAPAAAGDGGPVRQGRVRVTAGGGDADLLPYAGLAHIEEA